MSEARPGSARVAGMRSSRPRAEGHAPATGNPTGVGEKRGQARELVGQMIVWTDVDKWITFSLTARPLRGEKHADDGGSPEDP